VGGHTAGPHLRSGRRHVWLWTVTGPYLPGTGLTGSDDADDLAAAKSAFRATFDTRLQWAIRQNAPITWHE
jgi:hypothetical protein